MHTRRVLCCVGLLLLVSLFALMPAAALAADETTPVAERLDLSASYSRLEGISTTTFQFVVQLVYTGTSPRTFNLSVTGPQNWTIYMTPDYPRDQKIRDVRIDPASALDTLIDINATPPTYTRVTPGEYKFTLDVAGGDLTQSIDLYAVVTATYGMTLTTPDYLLNTTASAGKDNYFTIGVVNTGSASLDNITFSTDSPTGWSVTFTPDKITSLNAGSTQTVSVNIKPPAKAIAGDYGITITAEGKQQTQTMALRVTVNTPTIWGFVGVGIIVLVFAGLAFVFIRFSRR